MKTNVIKITTLAMILGFAMCKPQQDTPQPVKPVADINALFSSIAKISPATMAARSENPLNNSINTNSTGTNGLPYQCSEQKFSLTNGMDKVIAFNPNASSLFAGNIIQGKYVNDGVLTSAVLTSMREDVTVTVTGLSGITNASRKVKPTLDQIEKARNEILASSSNIKVPAQIVFNQVVGYSLAQSMLSLGINANWAAGSIGGSLNTSNRVEEKSVYIYFMQKYYDLAINEPLSPADFFTSSTKVGDLQSGMQQGNPMCFISSVSYGRILIAKITSQNSISDIQRAADASFKLFGVGVSANISSVDRSVLQNSQIDLFVLGGDATDATKITAGTANSLDVMNSIANYMQNSANKPEFALPISYVVKYLDKSPFFLGATTEYTKRDCSLSPNATQKFELYFDSFYINNDCDTGGGNGEFYYNLSVTDTQNRNLMPPISLPCSQQLSRGDKTAIILNKTIQFELPKSNGQGFKIIATLYEDDTVLGSCSLTERETIAFDRNFNFPWDISNTTNATDSQTGARIWWVERVTKTTNFCDAQLQYQVRLK
jgi:thiol-activated cytolysin